MGGYGDAEMARIDAREARNIVRHLAAILAALHVGRYAIDDRLEIGVGRDRHRVAPSPSAPGGCDHTRIGIST